MEAALLTVALIALATVPAAAQTQPSVPLAPSVTAAGGRPVPGSVYEIPGFTRAVERGTRARTGNPGSDYWVQHVRYTIETRLDVATSRVSGHERVVYLNRSPDTLHRIAVYLRQNVFAAGSPRREEVSLTGGVSLGPVMVSGHLIEPQPTGAAADARAAASAARTGYTVDGTVMWVPLSSPLLPHDSTRLEFSWSYIAPLSPADGREGREDHHVFFMGYWYPQVAVYDDVNGWVTDPYLLEAEFYMDPADYDVRITVPHGWPVGATGRLVNAGTVLSPAAIARLAEARRTGRVVHVAEPGAAANSVFTGANGGSATWHFTATDVRDFAWGTSDQYVWDATRALVARPANAGAAAPDTVDIYSFYRISKPGAAWAIGGARFTRDAIEQLSAYLWPYPWPVMTSMEGVLDSGGMEYPMMTFMSPWADSLSLAGDLMHETGHMWFPMQVGSNETRYPWMDEGFTQFDAAQGMRAIYGEPRSGGRRNDSEQGQRELYLGVARAGNDMTLMWPGDLYPRELYFLMFYDKTAQVLAALRGVLGEETFHRAFREYGRRWLGGHPYPYDFFNTIADVSGRDLSWFWTTWLYQPWPLDQAIASVEPQGDSVAITIEDRGLAPMPVRLAVTRAGGDVQRLDVPVDVWLTGARRHVVKVPVTPRIVKVEIDPDQLFPDMNRGNQVWPAEAGNTTR